MKKVKKYISANCVICISQWPIFSHFTFVWWFRVFCCWTIFLWFFSQICLHVSNSVRKEKEWKHSIKNTQRTINFQNVFVFEFIRKKCKFLFVNLFCIVRKLIKKFDFVKFEPKWKNEITLRKSVFCIVKWQNQMSYQKS